VVDVQAGWGGHEISAFNHLSVAGRGLVYGVWGRCASETVREVGENGGRVFCDLGGELGMTTHLVAFSLRIESVWRTPLRSVGPPWPFVE
jgi:hypothetical protein